ncbi:MAG: RloB domain-containing protein [Synechococcus sp. SB0663_bin_10]|nr:RloB domain-containing protein [Synechococcus sp. SB0663_bin_10]
MIVVTEGKKTEPRYLEMFKRIHVLPHIGKSIFNLRIIPGIGVPMTVVDRAIQELQALQEPLSGKGWERLSVGNV